jgi:hypothetical protein
VDDCIKRIERVWVALALLAASVGALPSADAACLEPPGDINGDGSANIVDVQCTIVVVLSTFGGAGPLPVCLAGDIGTADLDCLGGVDVVDVQIGISYALGAGLNATVDGNADGCPDSCQEATPCATGAVPCDDGDASTVDVCVDGFCAFLPEGSSCNPASAAPCSGHGACAPAGGPFACACAEGYAGPLCADCAPGYHAVDYSGALGFGDSSPFSDGADDAGAADLDAAAFSCVPDESCVSGACGPHGVCDDSLGVIACVCDEGYASAACDECAPGFEPDSTGACGLGALCAAQTCSGNGACAVQDGEVVCACDLGFGGAKCEMCGPGFHDDGATCVPDEACDKDTCGDHGTCSDVGGAVQCACDAGWAGPACEHTCMGQTCSGLGTCTLTDAGATCACVDPGLLAELDCAACAPGLELSTPVGAAPSCVLALPCTEASCNGNGTCVTNPTNGAVSCACDTGYMGASCYSCAPGFHAEGGACVPDPVCGSTSCSGNGACAVEDGAIVCTCNPGFGGPECAASVAPTVIEVTGGDTSVNYGESVELSATAFGVGNFDGELVWSLESGGGTLVPGSAPGTATYFAPSAGGELDVAIVKVAPACCPSQGQELPLSIGPPACAKMSGKAHPALVPVDKAIQDFMKARCTGGVVLGLNWYGIPVYRRGYGRIKGQSGPGYLDNCGGWEGDADDYVRPGTPFRIGSNTKAVTAAMVRKLIRDRLIATGRLDSFFASGFSKYEDWLANADAEIENVSPLDPQLDLVPLAMRQRLGTCTWSAGTNSYSCTPGVVPLLPAFAPADTTAPADCDESDRCFNGGVCSLIPGGAMCSCPPGFSGATCQLCTTNANGADPRWLSIRMSHILRHRAGFPRSVTSLTTALNNLFALRQIHQPSFDSPADVGPLASSLPNPPGVPAGTRVLDKRPSSFELVMASTSRCLQWAPGSTYQYSNLAFVFQQVMLEYRSLQPDWAYGDVWGGGLDSHLDHLDSPLDEFVQVELHKGTDTNAWGTTRSRYGFFTARTPNSTEAEGAQLDPTEARARDFVNGAWSPMEDDVKGILCEPNGSGGCTFTTTDIDYFGNPGKVPYGTGSSLMEAGAGAMLAEAETYLRFMSKYYVSTYSNVPGYGRTRREWSISSSHGGSWVGARAFVRQQGRTKSSAQCTHANAECDPGNPAMKCCPANFDCVPTKAGSASCPDPMNPTDPGCNECIGTTGYKTYVTQASGNFVYDPDAGLGSVERCVLPQGLDIFIATNQRTDPNDPEGGDYDLLYDAVIEGLCKAQAKWPPNPYVMNGTGSKLAFKN